MLNDADIETIQLQARANRSDQLAVQGICTHGWLQEQPDGTCKCNDCGDVFDSMDIAMDTHAELVNG
jgi:hypothetical protein